MDPESESPETPGLTPEEIERNKDKSSLKKELDFVESNLQTYKQNWNAFLAQQEDPESRAFADALPLQHYPGDERAEFPAEDIRAILSRLPNHLIKLSRLTEVEFQWQDLLPVPKFDAQGNFNNQVEWVNKNEFPRSGDHPHRVLIGLTPQGGKQIIVTAIPESISSNAEARRMYQRHVFIHEFFHTVEIFEQGATEQEQAAGRKARSEGIILNENGRTLAEWRRDYARASETDTLPASFYSSVYTDKLKDQRPIDPYGFPVTEYMAEDFVGYWLGILPNPRGEIDFRSRGSVKRYRLIEELNTLNDR